MSEQKLDPVAVLIAVIFFGSIFGWVACQQEKSSRLAKEVLDGWKPEEFLAIRDTNQKPPDPKDVQRYAKVLDQLDKKCLNTREEVAVMTAAFTNTSIKAGFEKPGNFGNLDSLKTVLGLAENFTDRQGRPSSGNCVGLVAGLIKQNKEAQAENEAQQSEQEEENAARERQLEREKQEQAQTESGSESQN